MSTLNESEVVAFAVDALKEAIVDDYTEILFSFIRQVIASMIGIYIVYVIIKK